MKIYKVPRGTSDILPDEVPLWEELESKARKICKSYGYREIRTPVYEDINLFKRSLGQTSDIVNKQLLELTSGKEDEGCALRPEGTASIVRAYLENSFDKKEQLSKFFYIGPMFRGERPQKGRYRQFHQIGVEAIGIDGASPFLDAEVIALAMHLLNEFGVEKLKLKINSLGDEQDKLNLSAFLYDRLRNRKNELCEDCQRRLEENTLRLLDCKKEQCRHITHAIIKDKELTTPWSRKYFRTVQTILQELKIPFEIDPYLVRGLDYYTHTVFEITSEAKGLGSQDAVGAGGRYAGLLDDLGGNEKTEYGAIGFALGIERILLAAGKSQGESQMIDAFVIETQAEYQPRSFQLLNDLRKNGISATTIFSGGSMKSQMGRADKANARFALIIGDQEFKDKTVSVKDMRTGEQETVRLSEVIEVLKHKLK